MDWVDTLGNIILFAILFAITFAVFRYLMDQTYSLSLAVAYLDASLSVECSKIRDALKRR